VFGNERLGTTQWPSLWKKVSEDGTGHANVLWVS